MPRQRTSTEALARRGAFKHDPQRLAARANDLKPTGELGPPARHLDAKVKKVWNELATTIPAGVASTCDRWIFELLVCLMAKFRAGQATAGEAKQIESLLSKMGMTPSDRSRIQVQRAEEPEEDPLAEFVQ